MSIGDQMYAIRTELGLTQSQLGFTLSTMAGYVITDQDVRRWEKGARPHPASRLIVDRWIMGVLEEREADKG